MMDHLPAKRTCARGVVIDYLLSSKLTHVAWDKWSQILLAIGILACHVVCNAATVSVSVGIDASEAQRLLHMNSTHEADRGVWVFPDLNGKVYEYRFDSTFGGKISGVGVGDPIGYVLTKLGAPIRTFQAGSPGMSYLFESSDRQLRVDLDAESNIEIIFLLKGAADLVDSDSVRTWIAPIFPSAKPVPHDPNERPFPRPLYHAGSAMAPAVAPTVAPPPVVRPQATQSQVRCISLPEVQANMPPPVLYAAVRECILAGRPFDADDVFRLAGLFWRFDVARVPDETAHGAGQVLIMNTMSSLTSEAREQFGELAMQLERDDPRTRKIVAAARRLGPPSYYPAYMVSHGLRPSPQQPDFNAEQTWARLCTMLSQSVASQKAKDNN